MILEELQVQILLLISPNIAINDMQEKDDVGLNIPSDSISSTRNTIDVNALPRIPLIARPLLVITLVK
ncbi:hypothetical protein HanIR_Chr11g0556821 [Helianthus annuus]|nr:hypothetical protein HanIR_Chr11g0556821 [Helianthus annuus]